MQGRKIKAQTHNYLVLKKLELEMYKKQRHNFGSLWFSCVIKLGCKLKLLKSSQHYINDKVSDDKNLLCVCNKTTTAGVDFIKSFKMVLEKPKKGAYHFDV